MKALTAAAQILDLSLDRQFNAFYIAACWLRYGDGDLRKLAYMIATAAYESSLRPMKEIQGKPGSELFKIQSKYWGSGFYGRGFVQITWESNYRRMGEIIGQDLVKNPGLALMPHIAAEIMVLGMYGGLFRDKKQLSDYFNECTEDWHNARYIINTRVVIGKDTGAIIGDLAERIYHRSLD